MRLYYQLWTVTAPGIGRNSFARFARSRPFDPGMTTSVSSRSMRRSRCSKTVIAAVKKEDMKRRGLASPDLADALTLTFAYPVAAHDRASLVFDPS